MLQKMAEHTNIAAYQTPQPLFQPAAWTIVLCGKALLAVVVIISLSWPLGQHDPPFAQKAGSRVVEVGPSARLSAFDSAQYLLLSNRGYDSDSASCAFYPLWPTLIRTVAPLALGHALFGALILSNGLSILAFLLFFCLATKYYGERIARSALILLLAAPGALFFSVAYTESLYLVLVLTLFLALQRGSASLAAAASIFLPLARPVGIFAVLPLAWHLYEHRLSRRWVLVLLAPIVGLGIYFELMNLWTGNALEGFQAQRVYPYAPSIGNIFNERGFIGTIFTVDSLDGMTDSALDRLFFLLFLAALPLIYVRNRTWFWYTLPTGLIPAMTSWFMSYRRYFMVCFPIFIVMAEGFVKEKRRWIFWYYIAVLAAIQTWSVRQFLNFRWAG